MKQMSFIFSLAILVLLSVGGYTGYIYWRSTQLEIDIQILDKEITGLSNQIVQFEVTDLESTILAKQKLDDLEFETVKWSKVIDRINKTVPTVKGKQIIEVLSYSGTGNDEISLSMKTSAGSKAPYLDIAALIKAFDESDQFKDNFVPSIAAATNEEGDEILSFNFATRYLEPLEVPALRVPAVTPTQPELETELGDILDEALVPPAPILR